VRALVGVLGLALTLYAVFYLAGPPQ